MNAAHKPIQKSHRKRKALKMNIQTDFVLLIGFFLQYTGMLNNNTSKRTYLKEHKIDLFTAWPNK
jgi:hypothetical protein